MDKDKGTSIEQKLSELTDKLRREGFYGVLELHFQNGEVMRVKKHETVLAKDLPGFKSE